MLIRQKNVHKKITRHFRCHRKFVVRNFSYPVS